MATTDAQCLLANLLEADGEAELPERWQHERDGSLTYRFAGSENSYTWEAGAVEEMTARWLELAKPPPSSVEAYVDAHARLLTVLGAAGKPLPDAVYHDLEAGEVTAVWRVPKQVVIVDGLPAIRPRQCA